MPSPHDPRLKTYKRRQLRQQVGALGLPCAKCGLPIDYSGPWDLDEIVPRVMLGDPEVAENVQPTHRRCNRSAGGRLGRAIQLRKNAGNRRQGNRVGWDSGRW